MKIELEQHCKFFTCDGAKKPIAQYKKPRRVSGGEVVA
jgi:hypothetical protein